MAKKKSPKKKHRNPGADKHMHPAVDMRNVSDASEPPRTPLFRPEGGGPRTMPAGGEQTAAAKANARYFGYGQTRPQPPHRSVDDTYRERVKGYTTVDPVQRYYYWDDGEQLPEMRPSGNERFMRRGPYQDNQPLEPRGFVGPGGRFDTAPRPTPRTAVVPYANEYHSVYDSEYGAVSDAYATYYESPQARWQYRNEYYPNYYSSDYEYNAYDQYYGFTPEPAPREYNQRHERPVLDTTWQVVSPEPDMHCIENYEERRKKDSFHFSEQVLEKLAAQAVHDVDGVLALSGNISNNICDSGLKLATASFNEDDGVVIDLRIVLAYGVKGRNVLAAVRENIAQQIEDMTGLSLDAVHIEVVDIMRREEFNAQYESQAPEKQRQQIDAQFRQVSPADDE